MDGFPVCYITSRYCNVLCYIELGITSIQAHLDIELSTNSKIDYFFCRNIYMRISPCSSVPEFLSMILPGCDEQRCEGDRRSGAITMWYFPGAPCLQPIRRASARTMICWEAWIRAKEVKVIGIRVKVTWYFWFGGLVSGLLKGGENSKTGALIR